LSIAGQINLPSIVREFQRLQSFTSGVSLALAGAEKSDAPGHAFIWKKSGSPPQDELGKQAFLRRESCYKCALDVLDLLYSPVPTKVALTKSHETMFDTLNKDDYEKERTKVLNIMQSSKDELFHDSLYEWYISKGMENELLKMQTPFLESFLLNKTKRLDLLPKYYLKNEKYEKAALFLLKLAESESDSIDLSKRVDYLSQALGSAKASSEKEELLQDIKSKLEVARVQQKVLKELLSIQQKKKNENLDQFIQDLNSSLKNVTYVIYFI
jgi:nuclear pore complex protein Nup155